MPKTKQAKLDYIKRWKERKREEAKQNGTYRPRGRPKRDVPLTEEEKRNYQRDASRKHNAMLRERRSAAREARNRKKQELNELIDRIKTTPYDELAKVKELIYASQTLI